MTAVLIRGRDDVLTIARQTREARGLTHLEMDELIGLGSGHWGKLERMGAAWGKQGLRMSPSIMNGLDALDLEIIIAPKGEIPSVPCTRDVRLIPESNVVALMAGPPAGERPGWFGDWFRDRYAAAQAKKKRPAARSAQRASVGGATC